MTKGGDRPAPGKALSHPRRGPCLRPHLPAERRAKRPPRAGGLLQTSSISPRTLPTARDQSQTSVLVKPAPRGSSTSEAWSVSFPFSLLSKFSLRCTCLFNSFAHSLKANKSRRFLKPCHARHGAGHTVDTEHIYRWTRGVCHSH